MFLSTPSSNRFRRYFCNQKHSGDNLSARDYQKKYPVVDPVSIGRIVIAKRFALRRRIWFRVLSRVERGVLDLTMRYVENIKSAKLVKLVTTILEKLKLALESSIDRLVRTVGLTLAEKVSAVAISWGNKSAKKWVDDPAFARFMVINFGEINH